MRFFITAVMLNITLFTSLSLARDMHVDPKTANDSSVEGPVKSISRAIQITKPGDIIHLLPIVYRK